MIRTTLSLLTALSLLLAPAASPAGTGPSGLAHAQAAPYCAPGETPTYKPPFEALAYGVPWQALGEPVECAHTEPSGDLVQRTTKGVFTRRSISDSPIYTSGADNWTLAVDGTVIQWSAAADAALSSGGNPPAPFANGVPDDVRSALPARAKPVAAIVDFLTGPAPADPGRGVPDWVVLYTLGDPSAPFRDLTAAWISFSALGRFSALKSVPFEGVSGVTLFTVPVQGRPAVFAVAGVGAHGNQGVAVRWDGSTYATVFQAETNTPGIDVQDLDGDTVPEVVVYWSPYCESYASSPRLADVYRWNGSAFAQATGQFPAFVAKLTQEVRDAMARATDWSPSGRACLYWALGVLATYSGDTATAAAQFARAREIDPSGDWSPPAPGGATTPSSGTPPASGGSAAPARLAVGGLARVTGVGSARLNVRSAPSLTAEVLTRLEEGTRVRLLEGPRMGDGVNWWRIALDRDGTSLGWAAEQFLTPIAN